MNKKISAKIFILKKNERRLDTNWTYCFGINYTWIRYL